MMNKSISGFSKLSKIEKIEWLVFHYFSNNHNAVSILKQYWNTNKKLQQLHDEFIENTISNYYLPFAIAPNFLINKSFYTMPMAIEESSVVAAASHAAKFWQQRGGFKTQVLSTVKNGQVHFIFKGNSKVLEQFFIKAKPKLLKATAHITKNMRHRGGGIIDIELKNKTLILEHYYQLYVTFETLDAMGANFINSCLEQLAKALKDEANTYPGFSEKEKNIDVIMSILSNYVPECLVKAEVCCSVDELTDSSIVDAKLFSRQFLQAIAIAEVEPYRAVTHNKGIMNGIDAVILATGNDFRAVEAGVHAFASRGGKYTSLTHVEIKDNTFRFWIEIPLALGTVGGLTNLHPLVKLALDLLGKPSAKQLMEIVAVAGLAQNFAAIKSLITTGIQQGHMKMHLMNMLNQYRATHHEKEVLMTHFKTHAVTHHAVAEALQLLRE